MGRILERNAMPAVEPPPAIATGVALGPHETEASLTISASSTGTGTLLGLDGIYAAGLRVVPECEEPRAVA